MKTFLAIVGAVALALLAINVIALTGFDVGVKTYWVGSGWVPPPAQDRVTAIPRLPADCGQATRVGDNWRFKGQNYGATALGTPPKPNESLCIVNGKAYWQSQSP